MNALDDRAGKGIQKFYNLWTSTIISVYLKWVRNICYFIHADDKWKDSQQPYTHQQVNVSVSYACF